MFRRLLCLCDTVFVGVCACLGVFMCLCVFEC